MSDENKKTGHGITGKLLQQWCEAGTFKVFGARVLCEALLEVEATGSDLTDGVAIDPRAAVAFRVGPYVAHMGVVLEDGEHFLHAARKVGVSRERLDNPRWAQRIAGYYRAP